jgi:peptide/nickel transport system substrate-binding protein
VIEDQTTRLTEFLAGEVDVYFSVAPQQVAAIEEDPDRRTLVFPSRSYAFINWNGRLPLFSDARVRRAMTLGINREQIIQIARNGFGETAKGSVPPFHWAFDRDLPQLTYNPDAARSLLDSAGWIDSDGDGVRERDGIRASFELRTNPNPTREDIMALVQADLAQIGIEVRTDVQEAQSLAEDITSPERRFDAFVLGWTAEFRLDDRNLFACSRIDGPFQWASYCNPRVDELLDRVMLLEDRSQALPLWHEYQEIIQRDQPYTFIYYDVRPNGIRQRVRNVEMDIRGNFINVQEWWIAPSDRS